jgi:hypothetical protein
MNKKSIKEYRIWKAMKSRCYSPSQQNGYYKKDNIQVCERWKNSFENFMADMGAMPGDNYSIERIDYTKDYCPGNCKWIPQTEQPKNRRNVLIYSYDGKTMILKDWARYLGIGYSTLHKRIKKGVPFERAINPDCYDRLVEINGEKKTVSEWCDFYNLNKGDVFSRIHRGWSKEDALLKSQQDIVRR